MLPRDAIYWRIAADPVAYHHRWRDAAGALQGNRRSAVNAALVAAHGLQQPDTPCAGSAVWRLMAGWACLPAVAELVAHAKQVRAATAHRDFLHAPPALRRFMQLGFGQADAASAYPMGRSQLRAWGAAYLAAGLAPALPSWLAQRMALQFETAGVVAGVTPNTFDHTCFWSALRHAQTLAPAG